jgi:hypothetical protein
MNADIAPAPMRAALTAWLGALDGVPCVWGESDCCMLLAGWLRSLGVAMDLPAYASEAEARRIIARAGGLVALLDPIASKAGLQPVHHPRFGDVCVIALEHAQVGAIWLHGPYCAVRTDDGWRYLQPVTEPLAIWRVPEIA